MKEFHFASENVALIAWDRMLRRSQALQVGLIHICGHAAALTWDDESGPQYIAFNEAGRKAKASVIKTIYGE